MSEYLENEYDTRIILFKFGAISLCKIITISISNNLPKNKRQSASTAVGTLLRTVRKVGSACGVRIPASESRDGDASRLAAESRNRSRRIRLAHVTPAWAMPMALAPAAPNTEGALVEIRSVRNVYAVVMPWLALTALRR